MQKFFTYYFIFLLMIAGTWITFEIKKMVFSFLAQHWSAIEASFESSRQRNSSELIPVLAVALFAIGTPILYSALSGYALFRAEQQNRAKNLNEIFMHYASGMSLTIVFLGGMLVVVEQIYDIPLQILGANIILFGIISLFSTAWAVRFFKEKNSLIRHH